MLLLYTNYTIIFWLLIGNSHADKHLLRQIADDQQIYGLAACTARCIEHAKQKHHDQQLDEQQQQALSSQANSTLHVAQHAAGVNNTIFQNCCDICKKDNKKRTTQMRLIQENLILQLVCRDEKSLSFRINWATQFLGRSTPTTNQELNNTNTKNTLDSIVYVIKVHAAKEAREYLVYLSDENFFTVGALQHNTTYAISAIAVHTNDTYSVIAQTQQFTTLRRDYIPKMITAVEVLSFSEDKYSTNNLQANIEWKPSSDMNCDYDMICFSPENGEYVLPAEIRQPSELYTYSIPNLTFSSEYRIGIRAKNRNSGKESELYWHTFRAPSCEEWFNYNFSICPPLKPEGLSVEQTFITEDTLSLNITWLKPQHMPDYYIVHILDFRENGSDHIFNVTQDATQLYIPEITIKGLLFGIHLLAYTAGGNSTIFLTIPTQQQIGMYVPDKNYAYKLVFVILAPILCIVIFSLTTYVIYNRRAKLQRYQERCRYFEELEKKAPIDPKAFDYPPKVAPAPIPNATTTTSTTTESNDTSQHLTQFQRDLEEKFLQNDELEIDRNDLTLHEVLGEGAFGLVRRGVYKQKNASAREVAVKMLKDQPNIDEIRAFRHEIEVMKSVEQHPNIVSLIGHCTRQQGEIMLLTEYCSLGNLQSFLREEWAFLNELKNKLKLNGKLPLKANEKKSKMHYFKQNLNLIQMQQQQPASAIMKPTIKIIDKPNKRSDSVISACTINSDMQIEDISSTTMPPSTIIITSTATTAITTASSSSSSTTTTTTTSPSSTSSSTSTAVSRNSATDNKSYGYDEICTNSCKCQVDVIISDIDHHNVAATQQVANQLEKLLTMQQNEHAVPAKNKQDQRQMGKTKSIAIKNCECRVRQKQAKHKSNKLSAILKTTTTTATAATTTTVENKSYFHNQSNDTEAALMNGEPITHALAILAERQPLSAADLLDIARQVALGMEYLGKNKVVHRDLAARNVLITSDRTIKIADFGLSRDIYQENIYKKTGNGKLPIKWLALESMTHQVYTTQSDVWSYGILLYEIVSLGGLPYPTIPANRLLHLLKSGYRMERPDNCGEELYALMHSCWNTAPTERPTFTDIIKNIDELSEMAEKQISYENIFGAAVKHVPALQKIVTSKEQSISNNAEDYLQPV